MVGFITRDESTQRQIIHDSKSGLSDISLPDITLHPNTRKHCRLLAMQMIWKVLQMVKQMPNPEKFGFSLIADNF